MFVTFQVNTPEKEFVDIGKKIGFAALKDFKPYVRYAEHPFVEAQIKDTKVNVVPCYDVQEGQWKSSADRSPFHTKFMINALSNTMKNEVRLLKAFLKANDIYGAVLVAEGAGEIAVDPVVRPWDVAALQVLVEEAGGRATTLAGSRDIDGGSLVSSNGRLHDAALAILRG